MVDVIGELEGSGHIQRRRNSDDRREYAAEMEENALGAAGMRRERQGRLGA